MKIGLIGSVQFIKEYLKISKFLEKEGHIIFKLKAVDKIIDKDIDITKIDIKEDYIKDFWNLIQDVDAILVLNYDKKGIKNYIGGGTLIGMSFAYVLGHIIYCINPLPIGQSYFDEILHMKPVVLNGDLTAIPKLK